MFDRIINQRVKMDKGSERSGEDFLQVLLKVKDEDEKTPLSMNHVKALLLVIIIFFLLKSYTQQKSNFLIMI